MDIAFEQKLLSLIEERLNTLLPLEKNACAYACLFDAARYSVFSGGKRIRPLLLLLTVHAFEGSIEKALDAACALELIHTYSLIHDDLPCMDDDTMRRDKPTLHKVYPEWHALLTGDFLLTFAFEVIAQSSALTDTEKAQIIRIFSQRAGAHGMIGGQMIDLLSQGETIDPSTLQLMHACKTGALFSAALECGALFAKTTENERILLKECGHKMGIAFQLLDDIEDTAAPESSDTKKKKATAISLLGLEQTMSRKQTLVNEVDAALNSIARSAPHGAFLSSFFQKIFL